MTKEALCRADPDLWGVWVGNHPGLPGQIGRVLVVGTLRLKTNQGGIEQPNEPDLGGWRVPSEWGEREMSAGKHQGREVADRTQLGIGHNFLKTESLGCGSYALGGRERTQS